MLEQALKAEMQSVIRPPCPPKFARALEYAVFSGGSRVRPKLCLAVYEACSVQNLARGTTADANGVADKKAFATVFSSNATSPDGRRTIMAAAVALELLHCASLVHDDLPAFDNADLRRGLPTVHAKFGEPLAVLVGDALIVRALEVVAACAAAGAPFATEALLEITRAVGAPAGIAAGQAWEAESTCDLGHYHRAKTGALFVAACAIAAKVAGHDVHRWRTFGEKIGEAYQVADDLKDILLSEAETGKSANQDTRNARPSAVAQFGLHGACNRLRVTLREALELAGPEPENASLRALIFDLEKRFCRQGDEPTKGHARSRTAAPVSVPAE